MEEKNKTIEQSVAAKVQGEASAPQRVNSPTLLAPPVQITEQMT